jgi:hypothetical protein
MSIIEELVLLENRCPPFHEESWRVVELMERLGSDQNGLQRLTSQFGSSSCASIVLGLAICLARHSDNIDDVALALGLWKNAIPGILNCFKECPEILSTCLSVLEGEVTARSTSRQFYSREECIVLHTLLLDAALLPIELPRLRDDVYLRAIHIIDSLTSGGYLSDIFTSMEIDLLVLRMQAALAWLESRQSVFDEEIRAARHLVSLLDTNSAERHDSTGREY